MVYVLVHEWLTMVAWLSLIEHLALYALVTLLSCVVVYFIASQSFVR